MILTEKQILSEKTYLSEKMDLNEKSVLTEKILLTEDGTAKLVSAQDLINASVKIDNLLKTFKSEDPTENNKTLEKIFNLVRKFNRDLTNLSKNATKSLGRRNGIVKKNDNVEVNSIASSNELKVLIEEFYENIKKIGEELIPQPGAKEDKLSKNINELVRAIKEELENVKNTANGTTDFKKTLAAVTTAFNKFKNYTDKKYLNMDRFGENGSQYVRLEELSKILKTLGGDGKTSRVLASLINENNIEILTFLKQITDTINDTTFTPKKLSEVKLVSDENWKKILSAKSILSRSSEFNTASAESEDWGKKYKESKDKDLFWKTWVHAVWGNYATKVTPLLSSIKPECLYYGFDPKKNKFIPFLRYLFEKNYNVTSAAYDAIHNSLSNGKESFDINNLEHTDVDLWNIIYSKDFYKRRYEECGYLLGIQKKLNTDVKRSLPEDKMIRFSYVFLKDNNKNLEDWVNQKNGEIIKNWDGKELDDLSNINDAAHEIDVTPSQFLDNASKKSLIKTIVQHGEEFVKSSVIIIKNQISTIDDLNRLSESLKKLNLTLSSQLTNVSDQGYRDLIKVLFGFGPFKDDKARCNFINDLVDAFEKSKGISTQNTGKTNP